MMQISSPALSKPVSGCNLATPGLVLSGLNYHRAKDSMPKVPAKCVADIFIDHLNHNGLCTDGRAGFCFMSYRKVRPAGRINRPATLS